MPGHEYASSEAAGTVNVARSLGRMLTAQQNRLLSEDQPTIEASTAFHDSTVLEPTFDPEQDDYFGVIIRGRE